MYPEECTIIHHRLLGVGRQLAISQNNFSHLRTPMGLGFKATFLRTAPPPHRKQCILEAI